MQFQPTKFSVPDARLKKGEKGDYKVSIDQLSKKSLKHDSKDSVKIKTTFSIFGMTHFKLNVNIYISGLHHKTPWVVLKAKCAISLLPGHRHSCMWSFLR